MTNEQKNLPELRFPEFDGEWEEKKLSTILEIGTGKSKVQSNESGKYNILGSTGIIGKSHTYDYEGDFILTARVGHYAGKLYKHAGKVNISDNTIYLYNFINKNFIYESLNVFKLEKLVFGSGQPLIKASDLKKLKIRVPVSKEQKKIGTFFSKLDQQIELEEKKLELLEQQKKGYMQKLFSQELRFKDENEEEYPDWSKTLIKDIFIFENNRRKPITSSLREKGNYPYYGATGIIDYVKDYLFDNEERLLIGEDGAKWGQFETSSFIANGKYWVNNHAHVVKSNNHNLYFMNYYLNFKELRTFVTGNAPAKLTHANLSSISIEMPIRNEQDKISYLLKNIENRINNQNTKIQLLQQRKKGLLQKMLV